MSSRFDNDRAIVDIRPPDGCLGQGDPQRPAIFREDANALAFDQEDHASADEQIAFWRTVLQGDQAVAIEHIETGRGHHIEEGLGLYDADRHGAHVVDRGRRAAAVHAHHPPGIGAEQSGFSSP